MRKEDKYLVIENMEIFNYYRERLINLCLSQFAWSGLPDTCNRLYFEKQLLFTGTAAMGTPVGTDLWLSLGYVNSGELDVYGYPQKIRLVAANGKNSPIEVDKWVMLYDNMTWKSLLPYINMWAKQLWKCHQVYNSNLSQQVKPYVIPIQSANQKLFVENFFNQVNGFDPLVPIKNNFDPSQITTVDCRVDFKGEQILSTLKLMWAEALSMLGITAETTKKERLLNDEITIDRQEDIISLNSRLLNRVEFCNTMNERYGFNLSVNLSSNDLSLNPYPGDLTIQTMDELGIDGSKGSTTDYQKRGEENG